MQGPNGIRRSCNHVNILEPNETLGEFIYQNVEDQKEEKKARRLKACELYITRLDIVKDEDNNALHRDIHVINDSGIAILAHINEIFASDTASNDDHIGEIIHNSKLQFSLRTPLSTIIGLTEMAMRELEFDVSYLSDTNLQDVQESMEKISQSGKRLQDQKSLSGWCFRWSSIRLLKNLVKRSFSPFP